MKQTTIALFLSWFMLIGCTVEPALPTVAPVAQLPTTLPTSLPTTTPVTQQPIVTPIPSATVTNTPVPPTNTPTPKPTATTTTTPNNLSSFLLPITEGKLFFTWTPEIKPAPEMMGQDDTLTNNLYMASPKNINGEWAVDVILTDTGISRVLLSPDQTKLAIFYLEDTNHDGHYNELEGDAYKLGIYNIAKNSLIPLAIEGYIYGLNWVDNQTLVLSQDTNLAFISIDISPPTWLTNNPLRPAEGEPHNLIRAVTSSPNGRFQAVGSMSGMGTSNNGIQNTGSAQMSIYDVVKAQLIPVLDEPGHSHYMAMAWSSDSQWVAAVPGYKTDSLNIVNAVSLEITPFEIEPTEDMVISLPTWSNGDQWLSFIVNRQDLWFWDTSTFIRYQTTNEKFTGWQPVWSPQEERVAVSFTEEDGNGWLIVDPINNTADKFYVDVLPNGTPIWSPDGEWILFSAIQNETSGYYVLNIQNGDVFLAANTTGLWEPGNFIWISD